MTMVPVAGGGDRGPAGADSATVKSSLDSTVASPATLMVTVLLVCAGAEVDRPRGQHAAGEVRRVRWPAAAAGHRPGRARPCRAARTGDGEGERRAAGVAFRRLALAAAIESEVFTVCGLAL